MSYRFRWKCQVKFCDGEYYMALDVRGQQNADSNSAEEETSKHLKVKQILALHTGVRSAPSPSPRTLRRNFVNFSPDKRIDPIEIRVVCRTVAKFRADLPLEQLDNYKIDDTFGSLVLYTDFKFFWSLVADSMRSTTIWILTSTSICSSPSSSAGT
jgi:hypothetical protein